MQEVKDEYYARHPPSSPEARCLLDQIVLCEYHLRRFSRIEDTLWIKLQLECPEGSPTAYALQQGERSFTRLQHRINSTRRAFHAGLKELERLEARDRENIPATPSMENHLSILGSLRTNAVSEPVDTAPDA
jgi:hypothetical protein